VLDRASTFSDQKVIEALTTQFIPVAIDQAYQRRQKDAEGEFYRKIAGQGPRNNFQVTTQGMYVAGPDGTYLGYTNSRNIREVHKLLSNARSRYKPVSVNGIETGAKDRRYNPEPPDGGLVIRVKAKVLGGYPEAMSERDAIFQNAVSRDNLWVTHAEHQSLVKGEFPVSLQRKIARFHLVDNTRGEPPMWQLEEVELIHLVLKNGEVRGDVMLSNESGDRGYKASFFGQVEVQDQKVTRFDLVAKGMFWGHGRFTRNPPPGKFPLAISFRLADHTDVADAIPPQGSRGWIDGYHID